jgi:hypothetical protein
MISSIGSRIVVGGKFEFPDAKKAVDYLISASIGLNLDGNDPMNSRGLHVPATADEQFLERLSESRILRLQRKCNRQRNGLKLSYYRVPFFVPAGI